MDSEKPVNAPHMGVVSFRIPVRLLDRFDRLANKARRQRADYLRLAIEEVIRRGGLQSEVGK